MRPVLGLHATGLQTAVYRKLFYSTPQNYCRGRSICGRFLRRICANAAAKSSARMLIDNIGRQEEPKAMKAIAQTFADNPFDMTH